MKCSGFPRHTLEYIKNYLTHDKEVIAQSTHG